MSDPVPLRLKPDNGWTVLGVDPGLSGAIVTISSLGVRAFRDFRTFADVVSASWRAKQGSGTDRISAIVKEQVGARPGQGVVSMFTFGKADGVATGALLALFPGAPLVEVAPQRWQNWFRKTLGIPNDQNFDSPGLVRRLYPEHADLVEREKDHNTADAILIAVWWMNCPETLAGYVVTSDGENTAPKRKPRPRRSRSTLP